MNGWMKATKLRYLSLDMQSTAPFPTLVSLARALDWWFNMIWTDFNFLPLESLEFKGVSNPSPIFTTHIGKCIELFLFVIDFEAPIDPDFLRLTEKAMSESSEIQWALASFGHLHGWIFLTIFDIIYSLIIWVTACQYQGMRHHAISCDFEVLAFPWH